MKTLLSFLSIVILASVASAQPPVVPQLPKVKNGPDKAANPPANPPANSQPCKLVLIVPQGARVWLDGLATSSVGTRREFDSMVDRSGYYEVKVRINGEDTTRRVTVYAGKTTTEVFEGVSLPASPFERSKSGSASPDNLEALPVGDDNPWFTKEETAKIKSVWPASVPWPDSLKFYSLPRRYQQMYTMNNGRSKFNVPAKLEDHSATLEVSGGMERIPAHQWKSVKGLALTGKIKVWQEDVNVRAYALVPMWRWTFPQGTVAYDVLFNEDGEIFEARTQTKDDDRWATKVYKELAAAPTGYSGAGKACASCHNQTAQIVGVPGRIYLHATWGDDSRFSWRPYNENGNLDRRWPLESE